jgi:hypothetical protein
MYCSHCNTPFTIVSIEEGKSKFCENCGEVIYKNEKGMIVTFQPEEVLVKQDNEQELRERINREKETRFKEQLERKEKEKEFRERLELERQIQEREELERKRKEKEEQERLFLLQLEEEKRLKERLLQIQQEKDRLELERYEHELVEREQKLREQIVKEEEEKIKLAVAEKELVYLQQLEAEKKKRERLENELAQFEKQRAALEEKLALEKKHFELSEKVRLAQEQERLSFLEKERKIKENLLLAQLENERLERERLERDLLVSKTAATTTQVSEVHEIVKEEIKPIKLATTATTLFTEVEQPVVTETSSKKRWFVFIAFLVAAGLLTLFLVRDKLPFVVKKSDVVATAAATPFSEIDVAAKSTDSLFMQQLKTDLNGKEVLSWNPVKPEEITALTLISGKENGQQTIYEAVLHLEDNTATKAKATIFLNYTNAVLTSVETAKITYVNIAPVRAWFSFAPVPNCSISVNTNNNPIQLKTCDSCAVRKLVSDNNNPVVIDNAEQISIKSDNKYDALIEFTYVPLNTKP